MRKLRDSWCGVCLLRIKTSDDRVYLTNYRLQGHVKDGVQGAYDARPRHKECK